jgi:hypothetical protein
VSTLAKVQAETLSNDVRREVISQWFADSWLLVAENDCDSYTQLNETAKGGSVAQVSDELRNDWETLAEQVTDLTAEHISPTAALFISQILQGWGSLPFDLIAKETIDKQLETRVYDWLSSSLKTGENK